MAATKRKFTVPSAEDLDDEIQVPRPKPLFNTYKKYSKSTEEKKDDTSTGTTSANDRKGDDKNYLAARTLHKQSQKDQRILDSNQDQRILDSNQDSLSKESNLEPSENNHTSAAITSAGAGSVKQTVGKTFRETFAFLEDTSHFKETVAKIKENEYVQFIRYNK